MNYLALFVGAGLTCVGMGIGVVLIMWLENRR